MWQLLKTYLRDQGGQFALLTAVIAMVLVVSAGGVLDISNNFSAKNRLQSASDQAALSGAYYVLEQDATVAEARRAAQASFLENCKYEFCGRPNIVFTAEEVRVSFNAKKPNQFLKIIGMPDSEISVHSRSSIEQAVEPGYVNVYFVFDISSSLMFPITQEGVDLMEANFEPFGAGGCAFACHADFGGGSGDTIAQSLGVTLREDHMRSEVERIADTIIDNANGQAKISLISFGWQARELVRLTDLKSGIDAGIAASDYIESSNGTGTNYETAFPDLLNNEIIPLAAGDGSQGNPKNIVVLITDGIYNTESGSTSGAVADQPINPVTCDLIKDTGAELFVLNLKYPDPTDLMWTSANTSRMTNLTTFYDQIAPNLTACASDGRYFEGLYNTAIIQAFDDVFEDLMVYANPEEMAVRLTK